jgi:signal transduction histidine kinase
MAIEKPDSSQFITALLSHDISNYNQTSRGYLEMLLSDQMGSLNEEQDRAVTICLRQTARIQDLIDAVRLLVDLQHAPVRAEAVDLDAVIRQAILYTENEFADRELRVQFAPAGRMARVEKQLEIVFRQLLANSVRHNDLEVVEVELSLERQPGDPEMWRILVSDNGYGIEPKLLPGLFERFASHSVHGAGVGLALARFLVRRWGGELWLESAGDGQGAVFGLTVPHQEPLLDADDPGEEEEGSTE